MDIYKAIIADSALGMVERLIALEIDSNHCRFLYDAKEALVNYAREMTSAAKNSRTMRNADKGGSGESEGS